MKKNYTIIVFALACSQLFAHADPTEGLTEVPLTGLSTNDNYAFHFYTADGKLNIGYTEVFIALVHNGDHFIDDFTVSDFVPIMDMGMGMKHSTPIGSVEKVAGKALFKTWFSFLMYTGQGGASNGWALSFNYTISGGSVNSFTNIVLPVDNAPANNKWLQSFIYNSETYYLSIANPKNVSVGSHPVAAYINKKVDPLIPYESVNDGFRIEATPFMRSMGHGSSGNTDLVWNTNHGHYEGTLNLSMEGDWRINLKVYETATNTLVAGTDIDANGNGSTHFWDFYLDTNTATKQIIDTKVFVYPSISRGNFTVETLSEAIINVSDYTGKLVAEYQSNGNKTIQLNVPSGLYFIAVDEAGKQSIHKVIVRK